VPLAGCALDTLTQCADAAPGPAAADTTSPLATRGRDAAIAPEQALRRNGALGLPRAGARGELPLGGGIVTARLL